MENSKQIDVFLRESNAIEDVWDANSFRQALYAWQFIIKKKELTPANIKKTHKILMLNQPLKPNEKGYFRKCQVWVGNREGLEWQDIPRAIANWCNWINLVKAKDDWKLCHIAFEKIHPFVDGNGRIGRILMNWQRVNNNLPILIIWANKKQRYYKWFK